MARSRRMSVQKRLRERKKAGQAELKRVTQRRPAGGELAVRADLEAYGVVTTFSDPGSEP